MKSAACRLSLVPTFLLLFLSQGINGSALEWQAEDSAKQESILLDPKAIGGKSLLIPISEDILRKASSGPRTTWMMRQVTPDTLKPGRYVATLRFAYSNPEEPLSRVFILEFTAGDKTRLIESISADKAGVYEDVSIEFEVARPRAVSVGAGWKTRSTEEVQEAIRSSHLKQSQLDVLDIGEETAGGEDVENEISEIVGSPEDGLRGTTYVALDEIRLERLDIPACIVAVRPDEILRRGDQAAEAEVLLLNYSETEFRGRLKITEEQPGSPGKARTLYSKEVRIAGNGDAEVAFSCQPRKDEFKRELKAELIQGDRTLDSVVVPCIPFRGTNVWQGKSPSNPSAWGVGENWSAGAAPDDKDGYDLVISGNAQSQPVLGQGTTVAGNLVIEKGGALTLEANLAIRRDLIIRAGTLNLGDHTLTIGGSCYLPPFTDSPQVVCFDMGEKAKVVFNTASKAALDPGNAVVGGNYHVRFQNVVIDKRGGMLAIRNHPLVVEKTLSIEDGTLAMQDGGEVWLGILRGGPENERILDVALKIKSPITPENNPEITAPRIPEMAPSVVRVIHNHIGPVIPASVELVNIAPFAAINVVPYMTMVRTLVDPDEKLRTCAHPEGGTPAKGVRYEFRYNTPQTIAGIRWAVVAGPWAIQADTNGDGDYDKLLRMDLEGKLGNPGGVWLSRAWVNNSFWPPVKAYGIQIVSLLGNITNNRLYDVQILSLANKAAFKAPRLKRGVPEIEAGETLDVVDPPVEKQFTKGFHIEPWMFGLPQWIKMEKRPPLTEYEPFVKFVQDVKKLHVNIVNMWPPKAWETRGKGTYEMDVLWPSQYDRHSLDEDVLDIVCDAFHEQGIRIFTMLRCPYPKRLKEFPETNTSKQEAPYVSRHSREYLAGIAREQAASGVDGVGIGYDEQQWRAIGRPQQADKFTRKVFEERYQVPFPEEPADTESFRKWIVFAYQEFASYLADAAAGAKAMNPGVSTKTPVHMSLGTLWNVRVDVGIAEDIVGHTAELDYARANCYETLANMCHYVTPANTKRIIAANKTGGADSLHNCPWGRDPNVHPGYFLDFTPVCMSGPPISHIMHGGRLPMYWRYNYVYYGGYDKYVKQAFSMLDTIAAWSATEAKVPRSIAVLKSRASEDWWQVRQRYAKDGNPMDQTRGFIYEKWLLELLLSNGYMFDMYYLEYPDDFAEELSTYDLVILPFPYSIKKEAFSLLETAVGKGIKVLVFDRQGETDEWGNAYEKPLFSDLIAGGKVSFVEDDVLSVGHHPQFVEKIRDLLDDSLGDRKPVYLNHYGNDVEVACLEKNNKERFLFLINWAQDNRVRVDVGVNMPAGKYQVFQRDLEECRKVKIRGEDSFTDEDLRRFRVSLNGGEIKIFYIHPLGKGG